MKNIPAIAGVSACAMVAALSAIAVPSALVAQHDQALVMLRGKLGIDPAPGSLLGTVSGLSVDNATLADALSRLSESSQVQIAFSPSLLPVGLRVDCDCTTMHVARTLDRLLADTELGYVELGSQVVVVPRAGQEITDPEGVLRGRVRSEVAVPIQDATVRLLLAADTARQFVTGTDRLGFFAFDGLAAGNYILTVAHIGYALDETEVVLVPGADLAVEIALSERAVSLEGVVVEGERSSRLAWFERSAGLAGCRWRESRQEVT